MANLLYSLNLILQINLEIFHLGAKNVQRVYVSLSYYRLFWSYYWPFSHFIISKGKTPIKCRYLLGWLIDWFSYLLDWRKRSHSERHIPSCLCYSNWWLILNIHDWVLVKAHKVSNIATQNRSVIGENSQRICL